MYGRHDLAMAGQQGASQAGMPGMYNPMMGGGGGMGAMGAMSMGGSMGSMLGQGLYSIFGHQQNPSDEASKYLNKIPGQISPYYQPYINAGQQAGNTLQNQYQQLMTNPGAVMAQLGQGYQQSPGYQFQLNQGLVGANNAAAAGGMLGSPMHQQQSSQMAEGLANQDFYNYLSNAMGLYGQGLQGGQSMYNTAYDASNQLGQDIGQNLMGQANNAYEGANTHNQQEGSKWSSIFGGAGELAGLAAFL